MIHSFNTNVATEYGIQAAVLLQNIYFWVEKNRANETHLHDGKYWTYSSKKAFATLFPYMSERQIDYALKKLIDNEIIITGNFNKDLHDRTLWYTLTKKGYCILQNCKMHPTKLYNASDKIVGAIPYINTYNDIHDDDDNNYMCNTHTHARTHAHTHEESITDYLEFSELSRKYVHEASVQEVRDYIQKSWGFHIGKSPNQTNIDDLQCVATIHEMELAAINYALSLAARNAAGSITGYAASCLKNWAANGLHSTDEIFKAEIELGKIL